MFIDTSRRRSPSTANLATWDRSDATSASVRSFTLTLYFTPAASHMRAARLLPMPKMWVSPMTTCLFIGMLMPAIRAIYFSTRALEKKRGSIFEKRLKINLVASSRASTLTLLVPGIRRTDDVNNAAPPHDFAVLTNLLYRRTNFHFLLPMPRRLAFFIRPSYWCDIMCEDACATKSMTTTTIINNEVPPNWKGMLGFTIRMISGNKHTAMMYRPPHSVSRVKTLSR